VDFSKNYDGVKKNREFQLAFKKGCSYVTQGFVCYYFEHKKSEGGAQPSRNRLGIVASKKVGNAVKRNRGKRVIREAFRIAEPELREKTDKRYDFVFVARSRTPELKSTQICELMKNLFARLIKT